MLTEKQNSFLPYLDLARQEALKSSCFRAQVGAIIVNESDKVLSTGFNDPPLGVKNSKDMDFCNKEKHGFKSGEGYHTCRSIHAEQHAILKLGILLTPHTRMFVFGHEFICHLCKQYIIMAQISQVILQKNSLSKILILNPQDWLEELASPQNLSGHL